MSECQFLHGAHLNQKFIFTHNCVAPPVHWISTHSKLAPRYAPLPFTALDIHAKSQSGYHPAPLRLIPDVCPPLIEMFSSGLGRTEASPDVWFPRRLHPADGLDQD